MPNLDVFGPLQGALRVESAVIALAREWYHTYLWQVEDQLDGWEPGAEERRPRTWQADIDVRQFPETQLPAMVCVVGTGDPESDGEAVRYRWPVSLGVVMRGPTRQRSRDLARLHAAALVGLVMHLLEEESDLQLLTWPVPSTGEAQGVRNGPIASTAQVDFTVLDPHGVLLKPDGPIQPAPLPTTPTPPEYPSHPTVETVDVDVDPITEETP